jgi:carbonic anhydrase
MRAETAMTDTRIPGRTADAGNRLLDELLEQNRRWVRSRTPRPLDPPPTIGLAVVGCYDPRLDVLLLPALGLSPGEAFLLRTAGALLQPGSSSMRSLGLAVFMFGVTDVLVVGHRACRMAAFDAPTFIESFRARGVRREAFGADDLRHWVGAIPSPQRGVELSMLHISQASFFPQDLRLHGAVLDEASGELTTVPFPADGVARQPVEITPAETKLTTLEPTATAPMSSDPEASAERPTVAAAEREALAEIERFARLVRTKATLRADWEKLRAEMVRSSNPVARLRLIEGFARRAGADSAELMSAFEGLRVRLAHPGLGKDVLGRMLQRLTATS